MSIYEQLRVHEHTHAIIRTPTGETRRGFVYAVDPETGNVALLTSRGRGLCLVAAAQVIEVLKVHDEGGEIFLPMGIKKKEGGGVSGGGDGGISNEKGQGCGGERANEEEEVKCNDDHHEHD